MSPRIKSLPEILVSRIAAGEVLERPASAIKELVENSLDADATSVTIVIEGAGRRRLRISDNGIGMSAEDARMALQRHATSKIAALEDLETIATFGFRGEALPSIASVSRLEMVTRSQEDDAGIRLDVEGGTIRQTAPAAREPGTTIDITDLFFNTPARFKFLKSDGTERAHCVRTAEEIILAAPHVRFELKVESAPPLVFPILPGASPSERNESLVKRLGVIWGRRVAEGLLPVEQQSTLFSVSGVVSDASHHQATSRQQILFVNNRPVSNRRLARAVFDSYRGMLPPGRFPAWVLFLDVDPRTVDVNVHPSKREVKLTHESEIYGFLLEAVRAAHQKSIQIPHSFETKGEAVEPMTPSSKTAWASYPVRRPLVENQNWFQAQKSIPFSEDKQDVLPESALPMPFDSPKALAQMDTMFIAVHGVDGFMILDQHEAHEKILYERLYKGIKGTVPEKQMLLVPQTWEPSNSVAHEVHQNLMTFHKLGFEIEPFGGNAFVVKGYPRLLGDKFSIEDLLEGMVEVLSERHGPETRLGASPEHRLAARAACRAAVKAGDRLSLPECQKIVDDLFNCDSPFTCPHGRPTVFKMSFADLKQKFRKSLVTA